MSILVPQDGPISVTTIEFNTTSSGAADSDSDSASYTVPAGKYARITAIIHGRTALDQQTISREIAIPRFSLTAGNVITFSCFTATNTTTGTSTARVSMDIDSTASNVLFIENLKATPSSATSTVSGIVVIEVQNKLT